MIVGADHLAEFVHGAEDLSPRDSERAAIPLSETRGGIRTRSSQVNAPGTSALPSLAWSGDGYGVSWDDTRDGSVEIYFSLIDVAPD